MGKVAEKIRDVVREQIERHGIVVWFDPERAYERLVGDGEFALPKTQVHIYRPEQGFLALRREVDSFLSADERPRLLVYVPLSREETRHALAELTEAGVVLEPGRQPPEMNTRLAVVVRNALRDLVPEPSLEAIVKEVEAGRLSLEEVERQVEGQIGVVGPLRTIYEATYPEDVILAFLTDPTRDDAVRQRQAEGDLRHVIEKTLGADFGAASTLEDLRHAVARFLLLNEFLRSLKEVPESLQAVPQASTVGAKNAVAWLVRHWRAGYPEHYAQAASKIDDEMKISQIDLSFEDLTKADTFLSLDRGLQRTVAERLAQGANEQAYHLAKERRAGYWARREPETLQAWRLIDQAGEVLREADRVEEELVKGRTAAEMVDRYQADGGWYLLDQAHRRLQRDAHDYDFGGPAEDAIQRLVARAQSRYAAVAEKMALAFLEALERAGFDLTPTVPQLEVFRRFVRPAMEGGKTAYIMVDALRYEMGRELMERCQEKWQTDLAAAAATVPTVTEVGMAALLPGAERGMTIEATGNNRLAAVLQGQTLKDRKDRLAYLEKTLGRQVATATLSQIAPLNDKRLTRALENAEFIVVTATEEIDGLWETNPALARRMHDDVFTQLQRGILSLSRVAVETVVIASDHGFLLFDDLAEGDLVDTPGGQAVELKRRVWVGKGGADLPGCLRVHLSAFGLGGDLELVTPQGLACFKAGGSKEYAHGGLSLQELVIPVLTVRLGAATPGLEAPAFQWRVNLGGKAVTTRFFTVRVGGVAEDLFAEPPRVRIELCQGERVLAKPVTSEYGYRDAEGEVQMERDEQNPAQLRENVVTLQVVEEPEGKTATLYLIDAQTGLILVDQDVEVDIAL